MMITLKEWLDLDDEERSNYRMGIVRQFEEAEGLLSPLIIQTPRDNPNRDGAIGVIHEWRRRRTNLVHAYQTDLYLQLKDIIALDEATRFIKLITELCGGKNEYKV